MPAAGLPPDSHAEAHHVVADGDTARSLGSGDLDVLATPRLLAWMEGATCALLAGNLAPGETSVGTRISVEHLKASPIGARLTVRAELVHQDGRLVKFRVVAEHDDAAVVGTGEITRVIVDSARFLARLA